MTGWRLYATTPGRATVQAVADFIVIMWLVLCYYVGRVVFKALTAVADVGHQVQGGANGISSNLNDAGSKVDGVPLIGDKLKSPLSAAGSAAHQIAAAGQGLDDKATTLAIVLALAVAIPPALSLGLPWLLLRLRFARQAGATQALAAVPGGERLLAMRALANRPLTKVRAAVPEKDPVLAWEEEDGDAIRRLAALEIASAGLRPPKAWRKATATPV